jgi:hypothetical protein
LNYANVKNRDPLTEFPVFIFPLCSLPATVVGRR